MLLKINEENKNKDRDLTTRMLKCCVLNDRRVVKNNKNDKLDGDGRGRWRWRWAKKMNKVENLKKNNIIKCELVRNGRTRR